MKQRPLPIMLDGNTKANPTKCRILEHRQLLFQNGPYWMVVQGLLWRALDHITKAIVEHTANHEKASAGQTA